MTFGHIVLEGYCDVDCENQDNLPCLDFHLGRVAQYCIDWDQNSNLINKCPHFAWCKANDYIIMTDSNGLDIACRRYDENEKLKLLQNFTSEEIH